MSTPEAVRHFYVEHVPAEFNRTLEAQRRAAAGDSEAARVLEEMEAVRASIVVDVAGASDAPPSRFAYDVERGSMRVVEGPAHTPFLVLHHTLADFEPLRRECGESLLGFLGGLAGLGDEMRLTARRVRDLRALAGGLAFERTGPDGFLLFAQFGEGPVDAVPRATIRLDAKTHARLKAGELDAQDAFLAGEIEVEGDEGMAIELALCALAPD